MGRIDKTTTPRHLASMSPAISKFIETSLSLPLRQLPRHLDGLPRIWSFSRGDLYHWIPLLNRLDLILESFVREYGLDQGPQVRPFGTVLVDADPASCRSNPEAEEQTPDDRAIVLSILSITRVLLDSCSNRILYSSKEHINHLLSSTDSDIVVAALKVGLQIARRYHDLRMKTQHSFVVLGLDIDNLYRLAMPFSRLGMSSAPSSSKNQKMGVHSLDLLAIINNINPENAHQSDWVHVHIASKEKRRMSISDFGKPHISHTPPASPSASRRQAVDSPKQAADPKFVEESSKAPQLGGQTTVPLSEIASRESYEVVKSYIHLVPKESQFDFLHRINIAKAMTENRSRREGIITVRLLAIAILAYAEKESNFDHRLGHADAVEPRLYQISFQLSSLLQSPKDFPETPSRELQTVAINTLEALCFQRSKSQEICNALMVSQSHGPLFMAIRNLVTELSLSTGTLNPEDVEAERWRDSFLVLLGEVPALTTTSTGDHLLNAGIMHPLIEMLNLRTVEALRSQPRVLIFLDNLIYSTRDSFSAFADAGGLACIADLAKYCIDSSLEAVKADAGFDKSYASSLTDYSIPYFHQQVIKWLLKFVLHRMSTRENSDARYLRNLMDIPALLQSLHIVISNGKIFGAMIWSWAANVLHVFINNEPTSYSVIAEAGLSKGLVEAIVCRSFSGSDISWQADDQVAESGAEDENAGSTPISFNLGWIPLLQRHTVRLGRSTTETEPPAMGILPSPDAMSTIPDVLSTLCLNEGGLKMVKRSDVISVFMEIFESVEHVKGLDSSPNNAITIGRSLDHFVRHHPTLQTQIFEAIHATVFNINQLLLEDVAKSGRGTKLITLDDNQLFTVIGGRTGLMGLTGVDRVKRLVSKLGDDSNSIAIKSHLEELVNPDGYIDSMALSEPEDEDNNVLLTTSLFRVLFTFFTRPDHCFNFLRLHGINEILDLVLNPALGPAFNFKTKDHASVLDNKPARILRTLAFVKPHLVLPSIFHRLGHNFVRIQPFLSHEGSEPFFLSYVSGPKASPRDSDGSKYVKSLQSIFTLCLSLAGLFHEVVSNRQTPTHVPFFNLVDGYVDAVRHLMQLQSVALWEDLSLYPNDSSRWIMLAHLMPNDWAFATPRVLGVIRYQDLEGWKGNTDKLLLWNPSDEPRFGQESSARFRNFSVIRYLLTNVATVVTPLLRFLLRLIHQGRFSFEPVMESRLFPVFDALASGFVGQLKYAQKMREGHPESYDPYLGVVLRSMYTILFDDIHAETPSVKYIRVVMICRLKDEGYFNILLTMLEDLVANYKPSTAPESTSPATDKKDPSEYAIHMIIVLCIHAIQFNSSSIIDATSEIAFNSQRYFTELRTMMLEVCLKLWNRETLARLPSDITRLLIGFVKMLFEVKVDETMLAYSASKNPHLKAPGRKYNRSPSRYAVLKEKFDDDLALEALYRCHDDATNAEEYCQFVSSGFAPRLPIPNDQWAEYLATDSRTGAPAQKNQPCCDPVVPQFALDAEKESAERPQNLLAKYNSLKEELQANVVKNLIDPLYAHGGIERDLCQLIHVMVSSKKEDLGFLSSIVDSLVQALLTLKPSDISACGPSEAKRIAATAHLFGLVLHDPALFSISMGRLKRSYDDLISFVAIAPVKEGEEPVFWIAQILLILEAMLTYDAQPQKVAIPSDLQYDNSTSATVSPLEPFEPFLSTDQKQTLLDAILTVLPKLSKDEVTNLSVVRVLALLSRSAQFGSILGEKHNIRKLFLMVRQMNGAHQEQFKIIFLLILRHIIEDEDTVRQIIKADLYDAFYNSLSSTLKIPDLSTTRIQTVLRNPDLFVEVASKYFTFIRYDNPSSISLTLKNSYFNQQSPEYGLLREELAEDLNQHQVDLNPDASKSVEPRTPSVKQDGAVHYLLCELLAYKDVKEASPKEKPELEPKRKDGDVAAEASPAQPVAEKPATVTEQKTEEFVSSEHSVFLYRCFILQCLTELLMSYNKAKQELIYFSRRAESQSSTPSKHHSRVLHYLLNTLIPVGTVTATSDFETRKRTVVSSWAIQVIVALCSQTGEIPPPRPHDKVDRDHCIEPELTQIRRVVLDQILKSFKEAQSAPDSPDHVYSRLLGLGDLVNRLVTKQYLPSPQTSDPSHNDQHKGMVKLMYEKNFPAVLSTATTDVDLNFPNARRAVKYLLRPLKYLSQLSMQLATEGKLEVTNSTDLQDDDALSSSDVSDGSEMREETPDLYRHSTLGVLEPTDDDIGSDGSDEMEDDDDQMYDDEYDEEMDYEDDNDDALSEDGEMRTIEGLSGEIPINVELMNAGSHGESSDDMYDEDSDTGSDDITASDEMDDSDEHSDADIEDELELEEGPYRMEDQISGEYEIGADDESWADEDDDEELGDGRIFYEPGDPAHPHPSNHHEVLYLPNGSRDIAIDLLTPPFQNAHYLHHHHHHHHHHPPGNLHDQHQADGDDDGDDGIDDDIYYDDEADEAVSHPPEVYHIGFNQFRAGGGGGEPVQYQLSQLPALTQHDPSRLFQTGSLDDVRSRPDSLAHPLAASAAGVAAQNRSGVVAFNGTDASGIGLDGRPAFDSLHMNEHSMSMLTNILNVLRNVPLFQTGTPSALLNMNANSLHVSVGPGLLGGDPGRALEISYPTTRNDPEHAVNFSPATTSFRWGEEFKIVFAAQGREKAVHVLNRLVREIVPFSIKHRFALEQIRGKLQAEQVSQDPKEGEEWQTENESDSHDTGAEDDNDADTGVATEARARSAAQIAADDPAADDDLGDDDDQDDGDDDLEADDSAEADESSNQDSDEEAEDEAEGESEGRVTVNVHGRTIDITGLGIDLEYLNALPDDLREEVVTHELSQRRAQPAAPAAPPQSSSIDPEFLQALPPDLRDEVLAEEARDRRRRERDEERRRRDTQQPASGAGTVATGGTHPFTQGVLQSLPQQVQDLLFSNNGPGSSSLFPGSQPFSQASPFAALQFGQVMQGNLDRQLDQDGPKKARVLPQLLDKSGVASLLRFMFIPMQGSARQSLDEILRHICLSKPTRVEVLSNLLTILQDGSVDVAALDYSFSQLSLRAKSQPGFRSPHPSKRACAIEVPDLDVSPLVVIQQCLRTLTFLCRENNRLCMFFLMESEHGGVKVRHHTRKGKAGDTKANKYPINVLIGLLESPTIIESSPVIEQLAALLQYITIPLPIISKKIKDGASATAVEGGASALSSTADVRAPPAEPSVRATEESSSNVAIVPSSSSVPAVEETTHSLHDKVLNVLAIPDIPEHNLRLVVNIIVTSECGPKAFRDTLSLVTHLSAIPQAKEIFGQELISHAVELGKSVLYDLIELSAQINVAQSGSDLYGSALAKFTPTTATQAKLLRIFLSLDYSFDPRRSTTRRPQDGSVADDEQDNKDHILTPIYESSIFASIWDKLSECLTRIRVKEMMNVATVLLPLIEVLMIICKNTKLKDVPLGRADSREGSVSTPNAYGTTGLERLFFAFTEEHRKVLNDLVRQNPKLMSGSFSLMVKNCKVLEFDNKRNFFTRELHKRSSRPTNVGSTLTITVRRDQVFLDSFKSLGFKQADEIKYSKLNIQFTGEAGVDAGGVTREWFQVLAKQMFNPDYALFIHAAADTTIFHPNVYSGVNHHHLSYFTFIGRIIGKAIYEGRLLDAHFSRAVYKRMLGKTVTLKDLESLDPDYYKSLVWMLENDITEVITEMFAVTSDHFGVLEETDLIENGRNISVTEENKQEYVRLIVEHKLIGAVSEQLDAFLKGFHDIIPAQLVSIFDEQELELLISGLPDIDVDDWKNNTSYQNFTSSSPQIQWFWRAVRSFDKEERAKLLQFVTGTSKVPLNGFKELEGMSGFSKFTIHRDYGVTDRLPSAHTCFNQLDLPEYETYEKLRYQLYTAFTAGNEYFGFA